MKARQTTQQPSEVANSGTGLQYPDSGAALAAGPALDGVGAIDMQGGYGNSAVLDMIAPHRSPPDSESDSSGGLLDFFGEAASWFDFGQDDDQESVCRAEPGAQGAGGTDSGLSSGPDQRTSPPNLMDPTTGTTESVGMTGTAVRVASIFFEPGSFRLDNDAAMVFFQISKEYAAMLAGIEEAVFSIHGFADANGSESDNLILSKLRALQVSTVLVKDLKATCNLLTGVGIHQEAVRFDCNGFGDRICDPDKPETYPGCRRVDIFADVTRLGADRDQKREEAKGQLQDMLDAGIGVLRERGGGLRAQRTLRLMSILKRPGIDTAFFDTGDVQRYVLRELANEGIAPDATGSDAMILALDAVRYASGNASEFVTNMMRVSDAIFYGIEEINKFYQVQGDTYRSAERLNTWAKARQENPNSILYAHRE